MSAMDHEPETAENIVVTDSWAAIVQDLKDVALVSRMGSQMVRCGILSLEGCRT